MSKRLTDLSITSLLDAAIARQVSRGQADTAAARYDLSVVTALTSIYRPVTIVPFDEGHRWIDLLSRQRPHIVFNLAQSALPLEPAVAGCLETLELPFTGSGPRAIALTRDKIRARSALRGAGIHVPDFAALLPYRAIKLPFDPPYIVKPSNLAGSFGIYADSVTASAEDVERLAKRIWARFGTAALCERFIIGRELRLGLIELRRGVFTCAGLSEWHIPAKETGWGFKTQAIRGNLRVRRANGVSRVVAQPSKSLFTALVRAAKSAIEVLGVQGYATVDFRVDQNERPFIIEVNSNPGLWDGGVVWNKPSFEETLRGIVNAALRRDFNSPPDTSWIKCCLR